MKKKFKMPAWGWKAIVALAASIGFLLFGVVVKNNGFFNETLFGIIFFITMILPMLFALSSLIAKLIYLKKVNSSEVEKTFLEQRAKAKETEDKKLPILERLILISDIIAVCYLICGALLAFTAGALMGTESIVVFCYISTLYVMAGLEPLRRRIDKGVADDDYIKEESYPKLYAAAYRAAGENACVDKKIKIWISPDFGAAIAEFNDAYYISLGIFLLDTLSESEVYCVLLHEFSHVSESNKQRNKINLYQHRIIENNSSFAFISTMPYAFFYAKYLYEYFSYSYACSVVNETEADMAMLKCGSPEVAASAIAKLQLDKMYNWERGTYDEASAYEPEQPCEREIHRQIEKFRERVAARSDFWLDIINSEILARNATHPTVKMRIESFGFDKAFLLQKDEGTEFRAEVEKLISMMDKFMLDDIKERYGKERENSYLKPLGIIEKWEKDGKPITIDKYEEILTILYYMGRNTEFVNLCYQIIEKLGEPANAYAYHMLGCHMLHTYDEQGIEYLYKSIELNRDMAEEALQTIGEYACIAGKEDKLNEYRTRAKEFFKKNEDVYRKMSVMTPRDRFLPESLEGNMMLELVNFIKTLDTSLIDKIYMVRKVIDEENFVSCVVVKPIKKVENEKFMDLMQSIFQYLDKTTTWEFALFDFRYTFKPAILKKCCIFDSKSEHSAK